MVTPSVKSLSVLVVDDEPMIRLLVLDTLEELGHQAVDANGGLSALEILRSEKHVDLLITDLLLPGMNGSQIAARARALRPALRIVYMTGADDEAIRQDDREPGTVLVQKPFSTDQLTAAIASLFG